MTQGMDILTIRRDPAFNNVLAVNTICIVPSLKESITSECRPRSLLIAQIADCIISTICQYNVYRLSRTAKRETKSLTESHHDHLLRAWR